MKRTLAILLATLMTLGMFAIGASAVIPDPIPPELGKYTMEVYNTSAVFPLDPEDDVALPGFQPEVGMDLEAVLMKVNPGDPLVTLPANAKIFWFVSPSTSVSAINYDAAPRAEGANFTPTAADVGKLLGVVIFVDNNDDNRVDLSKLPADVVYASFEWDNKITVRGMLALIGDQDKVIKELVDAEVINAEMIAGQQYAIEVLIDNPAFQDLITKLNSAYRAARACYKTDPATGEFIYAKTNCGACEYCLPCINAVAATPAEYDTNCTICGPGECVDPENENSIGHDPAVLTPADPGLPPCTTCGSNECAGIECQNPILSLQKLFPDSTINARLEAFQKAIQAVKDEADKIGTDEVADEAVAAAAATVAEYLAFLEKLDDGSLRLEDQVKLAQLIAKVKEAQLVLAQKARTFDENTLASVKYAAAAAAVAATKNVADQEFVRSLLMSMEDSNLQKELDDLKAQIDALEKELEEEKNKDPQVIKEPGDTVYVDKAWYEIGIYGFLGVGGWGDLLKTVMYYVLFGWRFGPYA